MNKELYAKPMISNKTIIRIGNIELRTLADRDNKSLVVLRWVHSDQGDFNYVICEADYDEGEDDWEFMSIGGSPFRLNKQDRADYLCVIRAFLNIQDDNEDEDEV